MRSLSILGLLVMMLACSDPKTRPETADKLKPMLVLVNPPAGADTPEQPLDGSSWQPPLVGSAVTLQFHFVGPEGLTPLTLTPETPDFRPATLPFSGWTTDAPLAHSFPGLQHVTVEAHATLPSADAITAVDPDFATIGFVRLRYAFRVSDGVQEVPVTGDFVVYRDGSVAGARDNLFGSTIAAPAANETITDKKLTIASTLNNPQDEPVKVGWYVSAGEVKNRRSVSTEWELPGSGTYTLIFTVRGKESRNGDIQIRRVTMP